MKKLFLSFSIFLLTFGIIIAQTSSNPKDYAIEDIYVYYGDIQDIGRENIYTYSFNKTPNFANETDNIYDSLLEGKIVSLSYFKQSFSIPIHIQYEKEDIDFIGVGYFSKKYYIPEEYQKYDEEIGNTIKNSKISYVAITIPEFLKDFKKDENPLGTIINCETFVEISEKSIEKKEAFPFSFKDTITDINGKKKKRNRTILILTIKKPYFTISDKGTVTTIILPQKEIFETPFGPMELFRSDINLKKTIPSSISVGTSISIWDIKDYDYDEITYIKNEIELKSLYQTRKEYKLRNDICARTSGKNIKEIDGEFYIDSIHLLCNDDAWTSVHSEVIKKSYEYNLLIDLRFIDNEIVFVIAPRS